MIEKPLKFEDTLTFLHHRQLEALRSQVGTPRFLDSPTLSKIARSEFFIKPPALKELYEKLIFSTLRLPPSEIKNKLNPYIFESQFSFDIPGQSIRMNAQIGIADLTEKPRHYSLILDEADKWKIRTFKFDYSRNLNEEKIGLLIEQNREEINTRYEVRNIDPYYLTPDEGVVILKCLEVTQNAIIESTNY